MRAKERNIQDQSTALRTILIFFLDFVIIEGEDAFANDKHLSCDEIYFRKVQVLLVDHYKKEHHVDFYAHHLPITPHYLTLFVKRLSGQTVSDFIFSIQ